MMKPIIILFFLNLSFSLKAENFLELCKNLNPNAPSELLESIGFLKALALNSSIERMDYIPIKITNEGGVVYSAPYAYREKQGNNFINNSRPIKYDGVTPVFKRELFSLNVDFYKGLGLDNFKNNILSLAKNKNNCLAVYNKLMNAQGLQLNTSLPLANQGRATPYAIPSLLPLMGLKNLEYIIFVSTPETARIQKLHLDLRPLSTLTNLRWLYLRYGGIIDIGPLSSLTRLEELDVSGNEIKMVPNLSGLNNLIKLEIGQNRITSLGGISSLSNLRFLNISNNYLTSLYGLNSLPNLNTILLKGNRFPLSETKLIKNALPLLRFNDLSR